jgi:hypothetical protein
VSNLDGATRLNGQVVTGAGTVGTPACTWPVNDTPRTVVGPPDRGDAERAVNDVPVPARVEVPVTEG